MGSTLLIDSLSYLSLDCLAIAATETSRLSSLMSTLWGFFQVALGLGFVIFVHELGHFLAAKTLVFAAINLRGLRCTDVDRTDQAAQHAWQIPMG